METLEQCCAEWAATGKYGTKCERALGNPNWDAYYTYLAEHSSKSYQVDPQAERIIQNLQERGILTGNSTILEIGAGSGSYTLPLAKRCGQMTALDCNQASLRLLSSRAAQLGLRNLTCVNLPWELFDQTDKSYDVAFAAMCPAICSREELLRMEALAKRRCCILTVARGSFDKQRRAMMQELQITSPGGMVTEASRYMRVLELMDRDPKLTRFEYHSCSAMTLEQVLKKYVIYFRVFGLKDEDSTLFLRDFFARNAVDGVLMEQTQMNLALIDWVPACTF